MLAGTGFEPVVRARALTAASISDDGRLTTHWCVRRRLDVGALEVSRPRRQRCASQKMEDIGARLGVESGFSVEMRATGVPK